MSRPPPDGSSISSYNTAAQPSDGSSANAQHQPASSYSTYSAADQSTPSTYSQQGMPFGSSSGGHQTSSSGMTPMAGGGASTAASPFYTSHMPMSTPTMYAGQPGSTGYPPSSMVGGPPYMSSSGAGMPGMQHMYTSSGPSSMPPYSTSTGSQPMTGMYMNSNMMMAPNGASYPAMGPVGSQPLPPHGPLSSMGPVGMAPGAMHVPMDPAAAQAEAARLADAAAHDVGAMGDRGTLLHFRPKLGDKLVCTCPMLCLVNASRGAGPSAVPHAVPLETTMLQYNVQCHISQAFVDLLLVCQYPNTWPDMPCVFFLPKTPDTTITELVVRNAVRPTVQTTMVVPIEDFRKYGGKRGGMGGDGPEDPTQKLDPELFMLPITNTAPGDRYELRVRYFHPMQFDTQAGRYVLQLPTVVPKECLPANVSVKTVLEVSVAIDTAHGDDVDLLVNYPRKVEQRAPGSVIFEVDADHDKPWPQEDLFVQYGVWRDAITAVVRVEAPESGDGWGTFALSVMPPGPEKSVCFPRDVVFVFDRSGSMTGEPMRYAKAALLTGLLKLDPGDRFGLVAFDHDQQWWTDYLVAASPENIRTCMLWVNDDVSARGTTDIKTPLMQALRLLQAAPVHPGDIRLPVVFLLTDGCVDNERDICKAADSIIRGTPNPDAVPLITVDANHRLVDAGQLVGLGLDKPVKSVQQQQYDLQQQQQREQEDQMRQPTSNGTSVNGTQQPISSSDMTSSNGTVPISSDMTSNGTSIMMPSSSAPSSGKKLAPRIFTFGIGPYCNHYFLKRLAAIGRGMNDVAFRAHAIQASMEQMLHAAALPVLSDVQLKVPGLTSMQLFPDPIPDVFVGQPLLVSGKFTGVWPEHIELIGTLPSGEVYSQEVMTMPPQLTGGLMPLESIFAKSELDQLVAEAWLLNNPPAMVNRILSLSLARNIPVANYTVAVGFETTPQRLDQMQDMTAEQRRKHLVKYAIGGAAGIVVVAGVAAALAFGSLAATAGELPVGDLLSGADMGDLFSSLGDMGDCCGGCGDCCGDCGDVCASCVTC